MKRTLGFSIKLIVVILTASISLMASANDVSRISDSTVKLLVERELDRRSLVHNTVEVDVEDHVVTISGSVSTLAERERIVEAVRKVYAVQGVHNKLSVKSGNDSMIAASVRRSIVLHPLYDAFDWIEAHVDNGVVTLSGAVREPLRKTDFEKRLMNIAGVLKIDNEIKVLPLSTYDDEIRVRAARVLYGSNPFYRYAQGGNPPIHIIVENGRVVLKGIVANKMDRQLAESLVRTNVLALDVKNELQVEVVN